jgi:hypothetical protein
MYRTDVTRTTFSRAGEVEKAAMPNRIVLTMKSRVRKCQLHEGKPSEERSSRPV